ncbi:MAG: L-serine ammonia-lyase [Candidatus Andeanibacterium colombiense]|uniref:L-serine dehydratase n=1 Tax=Candidatus Andeanibacterium colombiense TaxID=3121345 RepID=A0AAJ6BPD7_9SPHN|nr:MAG: L-serine ammonia-lyase [Sphingomonadaceae bacterium]
MLSVLDLFRIGIGPSSSHTVGPMRIARRFVEHLRAVGVFGKTARIEVELQGSLALTGIGHGTPKAALLGLAGEDPETVDPAAAQERLLAIEQAGQIGFGDRPPLAFDAARDFVFAFDTIPDLHPNGMRLRAWDAAGAPLADETWYSIGGGFIADAGQLRQGAAPPDMDGAAAGPMAFGSAAELLALCERQGQRVSRIVLANEDAYRPRAETEARLDLVIDAMHGCIDRGLLAAGILPGGLNVRRRAPELWRKLSAASRPNERESLLDWLNVYALAVSEENAAGGRVVTAPTNGGAGILPSVMRHYCEDNAQARDFLLTAGAIGLLYKQRASISGAEMGCQGEVGVAASMAAGGLAAVWGGTPLQVTTAAEIAMEHNLGLTCDPVRGLVQIPCIERNAIGAVKAVNAARLALHSDDRPRVSLDEVIETMRQTGHDMCSKYKETSQGGLAVHVVEC